MLLVAGVLAVPSEDDVSPGPLGLAVVVAIGVALFFLFRSMNRRMKNIRAPREEDLRQAAWEARQKAEAATADSERAEKKD